MYSTFNEEKSVVAERFIKTLKNKIYKHMTYIGRNLDFNVLDDIVKKYNNTVHSSIKMKPKDETDNGIMADVSDVTVSYIFIDQIKCAITDIRKTNKRPDSKAIFQYITSKYASNTTEAD